MKFKFLLPIAFVAILSSCKQEYPGSKEVNMEDETQRLSYAIGVQFGEQVKEGIELADINSVIRGFNDGMSGEVLLNKTEAEQVINDFFMKKQQEEMAASIEEGNKFLSEIATKEGIITTESGLMYEVVTEGTGAKPTAEQTVKVHYHGTLKNGEVFDSSIERGEPIEFPVGGVIPGWKEALQLMSVGSTYKLYIPSELAYGPRGAGGKIGPNEPLVFEVQLLDIVK